MIRHVRPLVAAALLAAASLPALAQSNEVNVYTSREPGLAQPLFDAFTAETGIAVNTVFVQQGIAERVEAEGENSPADVLMVVDYGALIDFAERGLTQAVDSEILDSAIPPALRDADNQWFALSLRARVIYVSKDRVSDETLTYEDLADPRWKGKLCIRSGQHPYNTSLFAAFIVHHGVEAAEGYIAALHDNLARTAGGGDRDGARDILAGICDIAVANSYYVGLMRSGKGGEEQKAWGDAIRVILPTFDDGAGTHVNVSGAAVAAHAPNRENAVKLLEFLVSEKAQEVYAHANYEHPIRAGVALDPLVEALGPLTPDPIPITEIAAQRQTASELVDKVGFDN